MFMRYRKVGKLRILEPDGSRPWPAPEADVPRPVGVIRVPRSHKIHKEPL
jgi:hypothetical protein